MPAHAVRSSSSSSSSSAATDLVFDIEVDIAPLPKDKRETDEARIAGTKDALGFLRTELSYSMKS